MPLVRQPGRGGGEVLHRPLPGVAHNRGFTLPTSFDNPADKARGSLMTVEFELSGHPFTALNGGPQSTINPTISFFAFTPGIEAADRLARALAAGGTYLMKLGEYPWSPLYAWVQDRFGVSWQAVPIAFAEMLKATQGLGPGYESAFRAMLEMKKLDIAALEAAVEGGGDAGSLP